MPHERRSSLRRPTFDDGDLYLDRWITFRHFFVRKVMFFGLRYRALKRRWFLNE